MARMTPLLALWALACLSGCGGEASGPRPPNLLLISLDTLRADHLGCYGYERPTSPVLDALAARSVRFAAASSHSPKTGPSHMSILTGLLPDAHGVPNLGDEGNRRLSPHVPTLAQLLAEAGWRTGAWHGGGHLSEQLGFAAGFEQFEGPGGVLTNVDAALDAMQRWADEPWFLFVHTYEIHDPYLPPEPFRGQFIDDDYEGRVTYTREGLKSATGNDWEQQHELFWLRVDRESEDDTARLIDLYDAGIAFTDQQVGRLLEGLAQQGLDDETIVVLLSDHGEQFNEHGDYLHNAVYEELLHVPLIVSVPPALAPSLPPAALSGHAIDAPVQLVDVLPTVLELLDVERPAHVQGRSLLPLMRGQHAGAVDGYANWPRAHEWALKSGRFKLIRREHAGGDATHELFDLEADPRERHDLAVGDPQRVADLTQRLLSLREVCRGYLSSLEAGQEVVLDEETRRNLEALGYLGGGN